MLTIQKYCIYILPFVVLLVTEPVVAQSNGNSDLTEESELITLDTKPTSAIVQLNGLYSFTGRTPFVIPYKIDGKYKIKAMKEGYETLNAEKDLTDLNVKFLIIDLKPKTRFKAAYRSLLFPGWGQIYGGNRFRGVLISAVQMSLGIGTMMAINDYNNSKDALDRAFSNFDRNPSEASYQIVQNRLRISQDDYNFRKTMLSITVGFWVYNVLDSILFFSTEDRQIEFMSKPLTHAIGEENMMVTWKIEF